MKTRQLFVFALAVWSIASARAGVIVSLDAPDQSGAPGSTLTFSGTITNEDLVNSVYLNSDTLNILAANGDFTLIDQFFTTVPVSLAPGGNSGDIELFDVTIASPFPHAYRSYSGTYGLLGGIDGAAQDVLGSASFSVTPEVSGVPEPVTPLLLLSGLVAVILVDRMTCPVNTRSGCRRES